MGNEEKNKRVIIKPQPLFQEKFTRSSADVCIGGGSMGCGKSYAALLMAAEHVSDPDFRMVCLRKNLNETKIGGGMVDDATKIYGAIASMKVSDNPRLSFPSSAFIDFTHLADQSPDKLLERIKGWQYSVIYLDEGTGYEWTTFKLLMSRNRGAGSFSNKFRITTNPKKSHWLRIFLDWWIDPISGYAIPERDGVVRYFFLKGEKVTDIVWSDSKEGVYDQCRYQITEMIDSFKKRNPDSKITYDTFIKSCVFYGGNVEQNKIMLDSNPGYIGSIAMMGEKQRKANAGGCWNIDLEDNEDAPIQSDKANEVFMNDEQTNGDNWITVDLADKGTDNLVAFVWDGLHAYDKLILSRSTPRENAERVKMLAAEHGIGDSHIIFDGTAAAYFNDYIPDAIPFISSKAPIGLYGRMAMYLKDECYLRLIEMIKHGRITIDERVGQSRYFHENLKQEITIQTEFCEECSVVRFKDVGSGKKRLASKKEMNAMLGKGRSMDVLDPCAMRMYPLLEYPYGEELDATRVEHEDNQDNENRYNRRSIYDSSTWA